MDSVPNVTSVIRTPDEPPYNKARWITTSLKYPCTAGECGFDALVGMSMKRIAMDTPSEVIAVIELIKTVDDSPVYYLFDCSLEDWIDIVGNRIVATDVARQRVLQYPDTM